MSARIRTGCSGNITALDVRNDSQSCILNRPQRLGIHFHSGNAHRFIIRNLYLEAARTFVRRNTTDNFFIISKNSLFP